MKLKKVLWICNIMLPVIGQAVKLPYSNREGWLSGIFEKIQGESAPFSLGICFPLSPGELELMQGASSDGLELMQGASSDGLELMQEASPKRLDATGKVKRFTIQDTICYAFTENLQTPEVYEEGLEAQLTQIIKDFKPDIMHVFGTEFPHALAAVRAFHRPAQTLVGIQGLCGEIAQVYTAGLPEKVCRRVTLRDWLRKDSLLQQQAKFVQRGCNEVQVIQGTGNITGRTAFDKSCTARLNPRARYFAMNETMRRNFYTGQWKMETCEKHSIFLGQGDYPLKGMHFVLQAFAGLVEKYPDARLYVAGNSIIGHKTLKEKLKLPAYGKYLLQLIKQYQLSDRIRMTGKLNGEQMKERFLKSHVFVCASVLENSPNTVGEAMLLGVPVVAFRTGGIPDMVENGVDGLLVSTGDVEGLIHAIDSLWREEMQAECTLACRISENARRRAHKVHDGEKNYRRLLQIYEDIAMETGEKS